MGKTKKSNASRKGKQERFPCPFPGCTKSYKYAPGLSFHKRVHLSPEEAALRSRRKPDQPENSCSPALPSAAAEPAPKVEPPTTPIKISSHEELGSGITLPLGSPSSFVWKSKNCSITVSTASALSRLPLPEMMSPLSKHFASKGIMNHSNPSLVAPEKGSSPTPPSAYRRLVGPSEAVEEMEETNCPASPVCMPTDDFRAALLEIHSWLEGKI